MARHAQDYREGERYRKQVRKMRTSTTRNASPGKLARAGDSPMEALRRLACLAALALLITLLMASGATAQPLYGGGQMGDNSMSAPPDNMMASPAASASATPNATSPSSATASATPTTTATRVDHKGGGSASDAVGGRLPSTGGASLVALMSVGALALLLGSGLVAIRLLRRGS